MPVLDSFGSCLGTSAQPLTQAWKNQEGQLPPHTYKDPVAPRVGQWMENYPLVMSELSPAGWSPSLSPALPTLEITVFLASSPHPPGMTSLIKPPEGSGLAPLSGPSWCQVPGGTHDLLSSLHLLPLGHQASALAYCLLDSGAAVSPEGAGQTTLVYLITINSQQSSQS